MPGHGPGRSACLSAHRRDPDGAGEVIDGRAIGRISGGTPVDQHVPAGGGGGLEEPLRLAAVRYRLRSLLHAPLRFLFSSRAHSRTRPRSASLTRARASRLATSAARAGTLSLPALLSHRRSLSGSRSRPLSRTLLPTTSGSHARIMALSASLSLVRGLALSVSPSRARCASLILRAAAPSLRAALRPHGALAPVGRKACPRRERRVRGLRGERGGYQHGKREDRAGEC